MPLLKNITSLTFSEGLQTFHRFILVPKQNMRQLTGKIEWIRNFSVTSCNNPILILRTHIMLARVKSNSMLMIYSAEGKFITLKN